MCGSSVLQLRIPGLSICQNGTHNSKDMAQSLRIKVAKSFLSKASYTPENVRTNSRNKVSGSETAFKGEETGVVVIGAGLAGLAAARQLSLQNIPFRLLEASDAVGGRVRTDKTDGFLLDRGFQIFITAYPEAQKVLDYSDLQLNRFYSGALVYYGGAFHRVADPFNHFGDSLGTLFNPVGTPIDKLLVGLSRLKSMSLSNHKIFNANETSILQKLQDNGYSHSIIDRFFRPFFGGIFFDTGLETSSRLFDFVFKCLALGSNTLPSNGIQAIPEQIARNLPRDSILLNSRVKDLMLNTSSHPVARLQDGRMLKGKYGIVLAVEEPEAFRLLGKTSIKENSNPMRSTVCMYFSTQTKPPVEEPILILNGSGKGIVNNMFFATNVAPSYDYSGRRRTLVSVSLVGSHENKSDEEPRKCVVDELKGWFGASANVESWKHLRTYRIAFAQPNQTPPTDFNKNPRYGSGVYMCGDYVTSATFDGALVSGRKAVESLVNDCKLTGVL